MVDELVRKSDSDGETLIGDAGAALSASNFMTKD
jgi:hypothetical protein